MVSTFDIEAQLKPMMYIANQEEQVCHVLRSYEQLFQAERVSFFRYSPIGCLAEGIAQLENGTIQSLSYMRDDLRAFPAARKVVEERRSTYYSGADLVMNMSSRYMLDAQLKGVLFLPILANQMTFAYICAEYIERQADITMKWLEQCDVFGLMSGKYLLQQQTKSHPSLSVREIEILKALANGDSTKEITQQLGLSEATIKQYIKNTLAKLDAKNRVHAVAIYLQLQG